MQGELSPSETSRVISRGVDQIRAYRESFPRGGFRTLDSLEIQTLLAVVALEESRPQQVAEALSVDKSAVTAPLRVLKEKRLVSIRVARADSRGRLVTPRKAGRELATKWALERGSLLE
jgi:DNA-binding MarR family transcriptional regulator